MMCKLRRYSRLRRTMQITLLRHGRPGFNLAGYARAGELPGIAASYDAAGVMGEPPADVVRIVNDHGAVVCSDLQRSLESAKALGIEDIHSVDALFREAALPHFDNGSLRLPVGAWVAMLRVLWLFGFSRNGESFGKAKSRATDAAQRLIQLAHEHESVVLVGHGLMNHLIARALISSQWQGPAWPGSGYWGYGVYRRIAI